LRSGNLRNCKVEVCHKIHMLVPQVPHLRNKVGSMKVTLLLLL